MPPKKSYDPTPDSGASELWTRPRCGHRFVTPNTWHSCGVFPLEDHFKGSEPSVRETFDRLTETIQGFGPVTVYAQKTRIVYQARTRFASVITRRRWLICQLWLKRQVEHPRLQRIEMYTYRDFGHILRLDQPKDVDQELAALIEEAYVLSS